MSERTRCTATKPYAFREGFKQCPKPATHGEWCRMHAQSIGGWRLVPPEFAARWDGTYINLAPLDVRTDRGA